METRKDSNDSSEEASENRSLGEKIWRIIKSGSNALKSLFAEDPRIQEVLTRAFCKEFQTEFHRMCKERREGAVAEGSFFDALRADSYETRGRVFDVLFGEYKEITQLPENLKRDVRMRLLEQCRLVPYFA